MALNVMKSFVTPLLLCVGIVAPAGAMAQQTGEAEPLLIREQGSFAAGGTVITEAGSFDPRNPTTPAGQTYHGDHLYAFYQIPVDARELPVVMWHGYGQFSKTWESTPDGREGFQTLFLRRQFPVYLIDQPRRGNAGKSTLGTTITPKPDEQFWFGQFRVGVWPDIFARDILDYQSRELATIAALAGMAGTAGQFRFHLNASLNTGLSKVQLQDFVAVLAARVGEKEAGAASAVLAGVLSNRTE